MYLVAMEQRAREDIAAAVRDAIAEVSGTPSAGTGQHPPAARAAVFIPCSPYDLRNDLEVTRAARGGDLEAARGRVILAHLGSGASLAAVRDGHCIDTTMGFTPTGGLMMGTRPGDLDPGVLIYLADSERMDAAALGRMLNHESGLKGVSDTSADIRDLLKREAEDVRAAEAIELFCYLAKKAIAAFAGALGGVDTLVFAGGIGENSPDIRARICAGLEFLGIGLSGPRNGRNAELISDDADSAAVAVRVIRTDEESVIAQLTAQLLTPRSTGESS